VAVHKVCGPLRDLKYLCLRSNQRVPFARDVAGDPSQWTSPPSELEKIVPQYDLTSTNITCGRNAFDSAFMTDTATVIAGDEMGFRVGPWWNSVRDATPLILSQGLLGERDQAVPFKSSHLLI
jgi:hypothetical protein